MSLTLRILLLIVSVLTALVIIRRIGKSMVREEDTMFWIFFAIFLALLGIFPQISYRMAAVFGIQTPANFVFVAIIALLIEKMLTLSVQVSLLQNKIDIMAAELAIRSKPDTANNEDSKIGKI